MKYYEYISDAKVDMLLPQVPLVIKRKTSFELGVDIKVFSAKIKKDLAGPEERIARLESVSSYIMSSENVGAIGSPKSWLTGRQTVRSGFIGVNKEIVAFCGNVVGTYFMLAGSASYVVGSKPDDRNTGYGFSFLPRMLDSFKFANELYEENILTTFSHFKKDFPELREEQLREEYMGYRARKDLGLEIGVCAGGHPDYWTDVVEDALEKFNGPTMEIEFVAKKLLYFAHGTGRTLLATPLYIARLD
jgi:hypothetical protein